MEEDRIAMKDCNACRNLGTKECPSSEKCYALDGKPHFERKERREGIMRRLLKRFVAKMNEKIANDKVTPSQDRIYKEMLEKIFENGKH